MFTFLVFLIIWVESNRPTVRAQTIGEYVFICTLVLSIFLIGVFLIFSRGEMSTKSLKEKAEALWTIAKWFNALMLPIAILYFLLRGFWILLREVWKHKGLIPKSLWNVFTSIHSEMRLLCMTDSMIGATIGYFAGSAIIGGLAGAIFGILNYPIVSVRWLKVAKVRV